MRRQKLEKLNSLLDDIPLRYLVGSAMLERYETDHRLVHKYVKRGWLQSLLASCRNVKVKRLFFVFADRHGHAWRSYFSPDDFDLGSGAPSLGNGGKFHPKYNISVLAEFLQPREQARADGP